MAGIFAVPIVGALLGSGIVGLLAGRSVGIPEMWSRAVTPSLRFIYPTVTGAIFGLSTIIEALLEKGEGDATPFPISVAVFGAGAILIEILLRLFALTSILWLLKRLLPRIGAGVWLFWVVAIAVALYEPWPFLPIGGGAATWSDRFVAIRLFLFNLAAAWFFLKAGFLATLSVRWGEYAGWHVFGQSLMGLR